MNRPSFPPPLRLFSIAAGVAVLCALGIVEVVPQFTTKVIGAYHGKGSQSLVVGATATPSVAPSGAVAVNQPGQPGPSQQASGSITCAAGRNGGASAPGVAANQVDIASTIVTTGVGGGFLGEAVNGIQAAVNEANNSGGVCGRRIVTHYLNTGWSPTAGNTDISNWIASNQVFSLVGEPDSEGLRGAIDSGTIDRAGMPVVGSDGMLSDQYNRTPWVFPVAASTVTNMHIIAQYAVSHYKHADGGPPSFGIVYDTQYKFGAEGAAALNNEVQRLTGKPIPGSNQGSCAGAYCGISSQNQSYSSEITTFNNNCNPCDVVVLLLEPNPAETWMKGEEPSGGGWYKHLFGGEPLFDDQFAGTCGGDCANMTVWTGYHPAIQPFVAEGAVAQYQGSLKAICQSCDPHNEFTEGAYLGTRMFIEAAKRVNQAGLPLTRDNLRAQLQQGQFDFGLASTALHYGGLPHLANTGMAAFGDNASGGGSNGGGSFNSWTYLETNFVPDPAPGQDLAAR